MYVYTLRILYAGDLHTLPDAFNAAAVAEHLHELVSVTIPPHPY